jgi:hypothetical protein
MDSGAGAKRRARVWDRKENGSGAKIPGAPAGKRLGRLNNRSLLWSIERQQTMSTTLDKIIEEVRHLPLDEQRQLRERLNAIVPSSSTEDELEDALERELAAEGIITLPDPAAADDADDDFEPIEVMGEPLSEMIIRERR